MFIGAGTIINCAAILVGGGIGLLIGPRFPERIRTLVTQALGLFVIVIGARSIVAGLSVALAAEVGANAGLMIVLASLLVGAVIGSAVRLEQRLDGAADFLRTKLSVKSSASNFIEGAVTATLLVCVGPLAILGALSDGLGNGAQQLLIKAAMDGFAAIAFASSFGVGVLFSVIPLAIYQGLLTVIGVLVGNFMSQGQIDALSATGGVMLLAVGLRLAGIKKIAVADMLPGLVLAPAAAALVGALR